MYKKKRRKSDEGKKGIKKSINFMEFTNKIRPTGRYYSKI